MKLEELGLPAAATQGKWFDYVSAWTGAKSAGVRVKLASTDLDEYRRELQRPIREFAAKQVAGGRRIGATSFLSAEAEEDAVIQAVSKYILLDWEGIVDKEDKELPCTANNRLVFLKVRQFRESVLALADSLSAFQENDLGNS